MKAYLFLGCLLMASEAALAQDRFFRQPPASPTPKKATPAPERPPRKPAPDSTPRPKRKPVEDTTPAASETAPPENADADSSDQPIHLLDAPLDEETFGPLREKPSQLFDGAFELSPAPSAPELPEPAPEKPVPKPASQTPTSATPTPTAPTAPAEKPARPSSESAPPPKPAAEAATPLPEKTGHIAAEAKPAATPVAEATPPPVEKPLRKANATPTLAKAASSSAPPVETAPPEKELDAPAQAVVSFFAAVQKNQFDDAYASLTKGSSIADHPEELQALKAKTAEAMELFGPIHGYELIDSKEVGQNLLRRIYISLGRDAPLRWRFYFYRSSSQWRLLDLRVDDRLDAIFGEPVEAPSAESKQ